MCGFVRALVRTLVQAIVTLFVKVVVRPLVQALVRPVVITLVRPLVQPHVSTFVMTPAEVLVPLKQHVALLCQSERLRPGKSLSEAQLVKN